MKEIFIKGFVFCKFLPSNQNKIPNIQHSIRWLALAVQKQFWLAVVNHQSAIGIVASNQPAFLNGAAIAKISTISSRCRTLNAQFGRRFPQRTVVHGKLTSLASQLASL
ncbi:hypothetical protein T01_14840 [Trichinella spiralis]|uniref:Uncharacterized protein n=1 Tax=Trichinella spiralis TaxID=6334 RepID=A0A0V1AZU0_TRISP|nr:hypothetical protein T01_14840 [Trichinella spiralis]